MVTITEVGPPLDQSEVTKLEQGVTGPLPAVYREFLLRYNGGRPSPDTVTIGDAPSGPTDVQVFFGIGIEENTSNILWNIDRFAVQVPRHSLVPIACDSGGNIFFIDAATEKGRIFYYDWTNEEPTLYEIAPGFEEFLTGIRSA